MKNAIIINLFGAPCSGKSTFASELFAHLKKLNYNVEYIQEFAKQKVWNDSLVFCPELYLTGTMLYRIEWLENKVDVIILDTSLLSGILFGKFKTETERDYFTKLVLEIFNGKQNLNFVIHRKHDYKTEGRLQTENEAIAFERLLYYNLDVLGVSYTTVEHTIDDIKKVETILNAKLNLQK